jgi:hypothetical protein
MSRPSDGGAPGGAPQVIMSPIESYKSLLKQSKPLNHFVTLVHDSPSLLRPGAYESNGHTVITLAIAFSREDVLKLLALRGADLNASMKDKPARTPLLLALGQTSDVYFRTLLAHRASLTLLERVLSLPQSPMVEAELAIAHTYWLHRARQQPQLTADQQELYQHVNLNRLQEIFLSLVGQQTACVAVQRALQSTRAMASVLQKPLVLLFAGPPGHGQSTDTWQARASETDVRTIQVMCA